MFIPSAVGWFLKGLGAACMISLKGNFGNETPFYRTNYFDVKSRSLAVFIHSDAIATGISQ